MKIGFDGITLTIPFSCGTRTYAEQLIQALIRQNTKNEFVIFATKQIMLPENNFKFVKIPHIFPVMNRQLFLRDVVNREKIDVFHYLGPYGSLFFRNTKIITTVQDMDLEMTYPIYSKHFINRLVCELTRKIVLQQSKIVVVPTLEIKREIDRYFKANQLQLPKIKVVPLGLNEEFITTEDIPIRHTSKKYFLAMGDFAPRKNIFRVIEAYGQLQEHLQLQYRLKIVCSKAEFTNQFHTFLSNKKFKDQVDVLAGVSNQALRELYTNATAFIYVSLYEGFGMPILEAQASGCPVITSNYGAMKEVGGRGAVLVDPLSIEAIKESMVDLTKNIKLRNSVIALGKTNILHYKWDLVAKRMLEVYSEII